MYHICETTPRVTIQSEHRDFRICELPGVCWMHSDVCRFICFDLRDAGMTDLTCWNVQEKGTIADLVRAAKGTFGKQSVMAAYDLAAVTVVHQEELLV